MLKCLLRRSVAPVGNMSECDCLMVLALTAYRNIGSRPYKGHSVLVRLSETASCPRTQHIRRDDRPAVWYLRWEHQAAQGASTFVAQRTNCQPATLARRADGTICLGGFSISEKQTDRYVRWQRRQHYDTPPEHARNHASAHSSSALLSSVGSDLGSKYVYTHQ